MKNKTKTIFTVAIVLLILCSGFALIGPVFAQEEPLIYYFPVFFYNLDPNYAYGLDGGTVEGVVLDPNNPQILYANTWGAGIYKSTDGGETWVNKSVGLRSPYIYEIAVDPANSNHILVSAYEHGIDESTDGGESWHATSGWPSYAVIYSIDYNPNNTSIVYAAIREATIYDSNENAVKWPGGVWKSTNHGSYWEETNGGVLGDDYIYDLAIDPRNPNIIYTANHKTGVFRTMDGGVSWTDISNGLVHRDIRSVEVDQYNNRLNAGIWDEYGYSYYDLTHGKWISVNWTNAQNLYVYEVQIDPNHHSTVYLTTSTGIYRCENPSANSACSPIAHNTDFTFDLAIDPSVTNINGYSKTLYIGLQYFGVHKSVNTGNGFEPIYKGIDANIVKSILVDPRAVNIQFVSSINRGLFRTKDAASHWTSLSNSLNLRNIFDINYRPGVNNVYYVGDQIEGVYYTNNVGETWTAANSGLTRDVVVNDRAVTDGTDEAEPVDVYGWMAPVDYQDLMLTQRAESLGRASAPSVTTLAFNPNNPSQMIAGKDGSGIVYSNNYGSLWYNSNVTYGTARDSMVDPNGGSPVYFVGMEYYGVMRSTDRVHWSAINTGFTTSHTNVYAFEFLSQGIYLVGTNTGIYKWNGSSWVPKGMANKSVVGIAVDPLNVNSIWAAVYGNGLYHSTNGGETWSVYMPSAGEVENRIINTKFLSFVAIPGLSEFYIGSDGGGLIHFTPLP